MIEPLVRWLRASHKGYDIASCSLQLASKCHADDGTLVTSSVEDMIVLLDLVGQYSKVPGNHLNIRKCNSTAFIHDLQAIPCKRCRDDALRANLAGRPIGSLTQDESLLGDYLGITLTASVCPDAHLRWTKEQLKMIDNALARAPLPLHIKHRFLLYGAHSKIVHTNCFMALSSQAMKTVNYLLEKLSRKF